MKHVGVIIVILIASVLLGAFVTPADPILLLVAATAFFVMGLTTYFIGLKFGARRIWSDQPRCTNCGYNLMGTLKAGSTTCPECGHVIADNSAESD